MQRALAIHPGGLSLMSCPICRHVALGLALVAVACRNAPERAADSAGTTTVAVTQSGTAVSNVFDTTHWAAPSLATLANDSLGAAIRRGHTLFMNTKDSLPAFVGSNMTCRSCHLDEGRRPAAAPLTGVLARFPKYMERTGAVIPLEDRVNYCFTRSLNGSRIPTTSREMQDIVAYLAFLSRGVPVGKHWPVEGLINMPAGQGDSARGAALFSQKCTRCHGTDGQGVAIVPAVWGPKSFSVGASMARVERAASFVRHNMPFDSAGTLTDAQAYDLAAFIDSHARPDSPEKEKDWPVGGAPADVPYDTKGHKAYKPPPLIQRHDPAGAIVPQPTPIPRRATAAKRG